MWYALLPAGPVSPLGPCGPTSPSFPPWILLLITTCQHASLLPLDTAVEFVELLWDLSLIFCGSASPTNYVVLLLCNNIYSHTTKCQHQNQAEGCYSSKHSYLLVVSIVSEQCRWQDPVLCSCFLFFYTLHSKITCRWFPLTSYTKTAIYIRVPIDVIYLHQL